MTTDKQMNNKTLQMNTEVTAKASGMTIKGLIVGKATNGIAETHIIKCIDNQLPNDVYKYDTFVTQLRFYRGK